MMNETFRDFFLTLDDFDGICRVCLKSHQDMVDIFESGIDYQLMEITKLKVSLEDKLPRALCLNCRLQMDHLLQFLEKAKSSDLYLRSLLSSDGGNKGEEKKREPLIEKTKLQKTRQKIQMKKPKSSKKGKKEAEKNKVYLIVVPEDDDNNQVKSKIWIKDLNVDNDNSELNNFCQTLVNDYVIDCAYPKGSKHLNEPEIFKDDKDSPVKSDKINTRESGHIYNVNLVIFECAECKESFEEYDDLSNHCSLEHNSETSSVKVYVCPACKYREIDKFNFLNHLKDHKEKDGFQFFKVNSLKEPVPLKDSEENIFLNSPLVKTNTCCKVLKVNLDTFHCTICFKRVELRDLIPDHVKSYHSSEGFKENLIVRYICPMCNVCFVDDKINFVTHLTSHREEEIYFIKVDSAGRPLELGENEEMFVSYEEAIEFMEVSDGSKKLFKVTNANSCDKCDYVAETFSLLDEHYGADHSGKPSFQLPLSCPACPEEFDSGGADEAKAKLYDHLKAHKREGLLFVEVNKNGSVSSRSEERSGLFTRSPLICGLLNGSLLVESDRICCPELGLPDSGLCGENAVPPREKFKREKEGKSRNHVCEKGKRILERSKAFGKRSTRSSCDGALANGNPRGKRPFESAECSPFPGRSLSKTCGRSCRGSRKRERVRGREKENAVLDEEFLGRTSFETELSPAAALRKRSGARNESDSPGPPAGPPAGPRTGPRPGRKPFECNVCHEKFLTGRKLAEHVKTHPKYKMGECGLCGKRLSTAQSLTLHIGRHFESNGILCPRCGKRFFEERNYSRHLLTHGGVKPHGCDFEGCEKSFYTSFELNRHKKYHSNTRDFDCPHCPKSFHEANHLTVHVRTHTGERPYVCPHCNKGFITRTRCKHHIKLIHQGIGYDLIRSNICKKVAVFETVEAVV